MATVKLILKDVADGDIQISYAAEPDFDVNTDMAKLTPAQALAVELVGYVDELEKESFADIPEGATIQ